MAVDVSDYVPSLKREVQPPGSDLYPTVQDVDWIGYLTDAFWEVRLDGFLEDYTVFGEGADAEFQSVAGDGDIPRQDVALVILYAGVRVLRNKILNMNTAFRAKAGPVEFEQQNSATMLVEMLQQLRLTKDRIVETLDDDSATGVMLIDAYSVRLFSPASYHGGIELTG